MEKINIAELLKDCPKGMELDCTMYEDICFYGITDDSIFPVCIKRTDGAVIALTKYGGYADSPSANCVIFPKGKTTWERFQRPYINGDIVYTIGDNIAILGDKIGEDSVGFKSYCGLINHEFDVDIIVSPQRLATEEEKTKLFQAIKDKGYKWDKVTKVLYKIVEPKFKIGDIIKDKCDLNWKVINVGSHYYEVSLVLTGTSKLLEIKEQDDYELIPNKFDINTLKPFDKVLVRTKTFTPVWTIDFYDGYQPNIGGSFTPFGVTGGKYFQQCIPYEGNEHLRGTTNDCDEYFKTWK